MTDPTLKRKMEEAEGPDRELDADIFIALTPEVRTAVQVDRLHGVVGWKPEGRPYQSAREVPHYTASLDAALALVERLGQDPANILFIAGMMAEGRAKDAGGSFLKWLPLAILCVLLTALTHDGERNG